MDIVPVGQKDYASLKLSELYQSRIPLRITGFKESWDLQSEKEFDEKISNLQFSEYKLDGNDLAVSARGGITFTTPVGLPQQNKASHPYYMAQTLQNPTSFFAGIMPIPFGCENSFYFKSRLWLAAKGTRTPLHRDLPHNLIFIVRGSKHIRLTSPGNTRAVYANSIFSRAPNFARLNLHEPDLQSFPQALHLRIFEAILIPGEMLYIPPLWWHDVKNRAACISANFWFAPVGFRAIGAFITSFLNSISAFWTWKKKHP